MLLIINNFQGVTIKGNYFYEKQLQDGINNIFLINDFTKMEYKQTIKYFKTIYDNETLLGILYKIINCHLQPFKNKEDADIILKKRALMSYPKATLNELEQINLGKFAGDYIYTKVMNILMKVYKKIKLYSDCVLKKEIGELYSCLHYKGGINNGEKM